MATDVMKKAFKALLYEHEGRNCYEPSWKFQRVGPAIVTPCGKCRWCKSEQALKP